MKDNFWDIFTKTGEVGAYLAYRRHGAYDDYYDYELWVDDEV